MDKWNWIAGHGTTRQEAMEGIVSASYALSDLEASGLINPEDTAHFRTETGLADFAWRVTWPLAMDEDADPFAQAMARARGFVVFLHGWDGSHAIWEQIPAQVCAANPRLVALAPDVNGFAGSPFSEELPVMATCDPAASMAAVERWIELLGLRSGPRATRRLRVITLVGHSMSGAGLFYLDESRWREHEVGRLAVAPALLANDGLRKSFYKALGLGIWAGAHTDMLGPLKRRLAPSIIERLIGDASRAVKDEHRRMFNATPKGVLAQTFFAMGAIPTPVEPRRWRHFHVILGHSDRLVGVKPMLDLLEESDLTSDQVTVLLGDHYMFSVSNHSRRLHLRNREILIDKILKMHEACRREM